MTDMYKEHNTKKLNYLKNVLGFQFNVYDNSNKLKLIEENVGTDVILQAFAIPQYVTAIIPNHKCICLMCSELAFKYFQFNTLCVHTPYRDNYIYYFAYDECLYNRLKECLRSNDIRIRDCVASQFTNKTLPKTISNKAMAKQNVLFTIDTLPKLQNNQLDKIIKFDNLLAENDDYYCIINKITPKYRIPQAICNVLSRNIIPINTHIVLEKLLQLASCSSAILVNNNIKPYKAGKFTDVVRSLTFRSGKSSKKDIIFSALENLINIGLLDNYGFDDNGNFIFESAYITRCITQFSFKREIGFYDLLPSTKQAPVMATFVNYLAWIINQGHKNLTIGLDTLLEQLNLDRLIKEHRLAEIAKILTQLRSVGHKYNLLQIAPDTHDFNSADVSYLLQNRTELHTFMQLKSSSKDEKEKNSGS